MIVSHKYGEATWIDLGSPTKEEIINLVKEWDIDTLVANELLSPSFRAKIDLFNEYAYLVLRFPSNRTGKSKSKKNSQEIDFIVGKNLLITVHYDTVYALHEFEKKFKESARDAGAIFYAILKELYGSLDYQLDLINEKINKAENNIFEGKERKMVEVLSQINRDLIDFHRDTFPHKDILGSFEAPARNFFGEEFKRFFRALNNDANKVQNTLKNSEEILRELRKTNDSLLTTKNNETMRHLTMMAFVTFPLTLLSSLFAIEAKATPIIGHPYDFWIILAIMTGVTLGIFIFFKMRKWL